MYWGKFMQHDNNRDGMGQFLKLTQAVTRATARWHPTVIHDLHEAQTYLYSSTGTGPSTPDRSHRRERVVDAGAERRAGVTKRGVPGVWTYGFYDGWVPTTCSSSRTATTDGRFYEVQS